MSDGEKSLCMDSDTNPGLAEEWKSKANEYFKGGGWIIRSLSEEFKRN